MKQNILALYLIKLSKWFSLVMPIIVLFYEDHGLGLQDVFILKSVYSVAAVALATSDLFTQPTSDWYIKQGIDKKDEAYQEAASHLDMDLIQYRLSPDDQTLTAIYTTPQYLSQEAREKIEPYLSEPKVYTWQKYHFQ